MRDRLEQTDRGNGYEPRWWHRWLCVDVSWLGMPLPPGEGFAQGFLTRRGARNRVAMSRRYGIERKVVRRG